MAQFKLYLAVRVVITVGCYRSLSYYNDLFLRQYFLSPIIVIITLGPHLNVSFMVEKWTRKKKNREQPHWYALDDVYRT